MLQGPGCLGLIILEFDSWGIEPLSARALSNHQELAYTSDGIEPPL